MASSSTFKDSDGLFKTVLCKAVAHFALIAEAVVEVRRPMGVWWGRDASQGRRVVWGRGLGSEGYLLSLTPFPLRFPSPPPPFRGYTCPTGGSAVAVANDRLCALRPRLVAQYSLNRFVLCDFISLGRGTGDG